MTTLRLQSLCWRRFRIVSAAGVQTAWCCSSNGGSAIIQNANPHAGEFLVAIDIEESRDRSAPILRLACQIEPEWLIDLFPDRVLDRRSVEWTRQEWERVEAVNALVS